MPLRVRNPQPHNERGARNALAHGKNVPLGARAGAFPDRPRTSTLLGCHPGRHGGASAVAVLLAVAQLEVLLAFFLGILYILPACLPTSCTAAAPAVAFTVTSSPNDDWFEETARPVAPSCGVESVSDPGCFCNGTVNVLPRVLS